VEAQWYARMVILGAGAVLAACGGSDESKGGGPSGSGATTAGGSNSGGDTTSGGSDSGGSDSGGSDSGGDGSGATSSGGKPSGGAGGNAGGGAGGNAGRGAGGNAGGGAGGAPGAPDGIAVDYPGDQGIESDPAVIFADDFESYDDATDLWDRWDNTYQQSETVIVTDAGSVFAGNQSVAFTLPNNDAELSNAVEQVVSPEVDTLYLRWYQKIDGNDDIVGSHHNGGAISAHYQGPGLRADEAKQFLAAFESWRGDAAETSPGALNAYVYHFDQRDIWGDHFFPTGLVSPNTSLPFDFGADFVARRDITPELDRWYCYELMLSANTVGSRDGRITLWLDGHLIADFGNLVFRDDPAIKIDRFSVMFHAGSNPGAATTKYVDNVVAATSYVGPMIP